MACKEKKVLTEARIAKRAEAAEARATAKTAALNPTPPEPPEPGLICWWCVHGLPQRPCIHLPIKYDDRRNIFTTIGNFCSWACAKAYANDMGTSRSGEIQSILAMMRLRAFGKYVPLWPAPKRQALKCFGGTMTIEEFRKFGGLVEPPQLHYPFEKIVVAGAAASAETSTTGIIEAPNQAGRMAAIENATAQTDTLKLRRTKPLARSTSQLENALGIKRKGKA